MGTSVIESMVRIGSLRWMAVDVTRAMCDCMAGFTFYAAPS